MHTFFSFSETLTTLRFILMWAKCELLRAGCKKANQFDQALIPGKSMPTTNVKPYTHNWSALFV